MGVLKLDSSPVWDGQILHLSAIKKTEPPKFQFSKPTKTSPKHQNNSLLNIFQSHLFLCSPWVIFLPPTALHRARGVGGVRSVLVKVIVAPPTAVLGDVSISGVEAASHRSSSRKNSSGHLGGFKLLMSENLSNVGWLLFFQNHKLYQKSFFAAKPQQKRGWAPFKKKKHHALKNQPGSQVTTSGDGRRSPKHHHRGTTEKLGKPSGLKDTDEVGRWFVEWCGSWTWKGAVAHRIQLYLPSFDSFFMVNVVGNGLFFLKIHLISERAFWNKIVTIFPHLNGAWIVGMDRGETTKWIMCSRTLYRWQFRILAIFHDLSGECEFVKNLHPECLWWLENATCCALTHRWSKRID